MWREKGKREVQQPRLDGFSWSAHLCKRIIWFTRQRVAARGNSGVVEGKRLIGQKSVVISFINATMLFLHCVPVVNISALFMFLPCEFYVAYKTQPSTLTGPRLQAATYTHTTYITYTETGAPRACLRTPANTRGSNKSEQRQQTVA